MGLPFFVNCSFLIQRVIYFETAPFILISIVISFLKRDKHIILLSQVIFILNLKNINCIIKFKSMSVNG